MAEVDYAEPAGLRIGRLTTPVAVAVDGSPSSLAALRWAVGLAEETGADLELLMVVWAPEIDNRAGIGQPGPDAVLKAAAEEAHHLAPDVTVRLRTLHGAVLEQLTDVSRQREILVIGCDDEDAGEVSRRAPIAHRLARAIDRRLVVIGARSGRPCRITR